MVVERQPLSSENSPEHHAEIDHTKRARSTPAIYRPPAARKLEALRMKQNVEVVPIQAKQSPPKMEKTRTRQRRPDLQVYVPRAKRASMMDQKISESPEQKEVSSLHNQELCDVKKEIPYVPSCVQSPVNTCIDKTNLILPQSSSKSDVENKLVSRQVDINCGVTGEKYLNSSGVNCNEVEDRVKNDVPSNEKDNSCFDCVISGSNKFEWEKVEERESNDLYSSISDISNTGNESISVNSVDSKDLDGLVMNNSGNVLLSNCESKIGEDISRENDLKSCLESDNEEIEEKVSTVENSYILSNSSDLDLISVNAGQDCSVDCSIEQISRKSRSVSDVLIISDSETPVDSSSKPEVVNIEEKTSIIDTKNKRCKTSAKLNTAEEKSKCPTKTASASIASSNSPALSLNPDECTWDMLFDDNGDCLDPKIMEELTNAVGCVTIEKPQSDYNRFLSNKEINLPGGDDEYAHVVEIYNFPAEFKTQDLLAIFAAYKNGGFEIKWVDDTHALGVFSSSRVAADVLAYNHPLVKTRPLSEATPESRLKARRSAEFLQPYRARPETCVALARRLVTGALGMKISTSREEREAERRLLKEAREKKRLAARQQLDAWEGTIR